MVQGAGLVLPGTLYHPGTWLTLRDFISVGPNLVWLDQTPQKAIHQIRLLNNHLRNDYEFVRIPKIFSKIHRLVPRKIAETQFFHFSPVPHTFPLTKMSDGSAHAPIVVPAPTTTQSRAWVFTLNNHSSVDVPNTFEGKYCIWQEEQGEAGTKHLQGYIVWNTPKRLSAIKKYAPTAHWEVRRGTHDQAKAYCSKEETRLSGPFTYGEEPLGSGTRSDLISLKRSIDEGKSQLELFEDHFEPMLKYHKGIALYRSLKVPPRTEKTKVIVLFGPTGTGKSYHAHTQFPNAASVSPPTESKGPIWFDGYDGNFATIIDEFYGWIRHDTMLRLCDAYAYRAPIKGGFVNFCSKYLIITSNQPPSGWYDFSKLPDSYRPLERRIDLIIEKHRRGAYKIHKSPVALRDLPLRQIRDDHPPFDQGGGSTSPRFLHPDSSGQPDFGPPSDAETQDVLPGLTCYKSFWGYPNPVTVESDTIDFSLFFPDLAPIQ